MKEGALVIDGKNYVSSARAAQLVGYTKDYVGQLARAGKIESKLIGRSWYVSEESITQHKLTVHYTLTKPKKPRQKDDPIHISRESEKTIENKDISSKSKVIRSAPLGRNEEIGLSEKSIFSLGDVQTQRDDRDLYPTPRKHNVANDPLLHSEIYYEKYEEATPVHKENAAVEHVKKGTPQPDQGVALSVRLRTSVPKQQRFSGGLRGEFRNSGGGRMKRAVMDGVILPDSVSVPPSQYRPVQEAYTPDFIESPEDEYEDASYDYSPRLHTRSISFLGAIVIVLVIVVLYILA